MKSELPRIRQLPACETRVETGPIQFGEDWPGIFFRGDTAAGYAVHLEQLLQGSADAITMGVVRSLLADLHSSNLIRRSEKSPPEAP